ncbi:MAG: hypothetical protein ACTH2Q_10255 [Propionibacteriaceae bacterium]
MYDMYPDHWTEQEAQRASTSVRRDDEEARPRRRQRKQHCVSPPVVRIQAERH